LIFYFYAMGIYNKNLAIGRRRTLRKNLTQTEKILWHRLRGKKFYGIRFKRQYSVNFYILDFYCPKFRLAIEIDGGYHLKLKVKEYDQARQDCIESLGIKFIRFSNQQVIFEFDKVLK